MRLRTTALPTRREVMKPARTGAFGSALFKTPSVSVPPRKEVPSVRTRWNSEPRVSRRDFGKRRRFCIGRPYSARRRLSVVGQAHRLPRKSGNRERLPYKSDASVQQKSSPNSFGEDFAKNLP